MGRATVGAAGRREVVSQVAGGRSAK